MSPIQPGTASADDPLVRWLQQLTDPDWRMQQRAAYELCRLRDPAMIPTLIALLERKDSLIAHYAALVLSQLGEVAIPPILALFQDPASDHELRESALMLLGQLHARTAVIPLLATLKLTDSTDRKYIPRILGEIGDPVPSSR